MLLFDFSFLNWKHSFWKNLVQKLKNCQIKLKFGTKTNSKIANLMVKSGGRFFYFELDTMF